MFDPSKNSIQVSLIFVLLLSVSISLDLYADDQTTQVRLDLSEHLNRLQVMDLRTRIAAARYQDDAEYLDRRTIETPLSEFLSEVQEGDILSLRSANLYGAIAARISDFPGQFAHLAIVVNNPSSNKLEIIESVVIDGAVITTLENAVAGRGRIAIFRNKDREMGRSASREIFALMSKKFKTERVPYDVVFDNVDHSALSCTEVTSFAYSLIGIQTVPMYPSHLEMLSSEIKNQIGIHNDEVFTPQDLEIDPRFDLIKEWRSVTSLPQIYRHDAIYGRLFTWMKNGDLVLQPDIMASIFVPFFGHYIARRMGYPNPLGPEARAMIRYGVSFLYYVHKSERELDLELLGKNTDHF